MVDFSKFNQKAPAEGAQDEELNVMDEELAEAEWQLAVEGKAKLREERKATRKLSEDFAPGYYEDFKVLDITTTDPREWIVPRPSEEEKTALSSVALSSPR